MEFTIENSQKYSELKAGNYTCTFIGLTPMETSKGKAYRWEFRSDQGETISGLSDGNGPPSPANKTGRWLAALSGLPLVKDTKIVPANYIGKRYLVIVQPGGNGKNNIYTFTQST